MCVPRKSGFIAALVSQNIKSWSFTVPFFTLLLVGLGIDSSNTTQQNQVANDISQLNDNSQLLVDIVPIDVPTSLSNEVEPSFADAAIVSAAIEPVEKPVSVDVKLSKVKWQFANLVKPEPQLQSRQSILNQALPTKPVTAIVQPKKLAAVASPTSKTGPSCLCQPTYPQIYQSQVSPSRVQYTSLAPIRSLSSMAFSQQTSYAKSSKSKSSEPDGLSDEEIRRRNAYSKARNQALARANKLRERRHRQKLPIRKRKTLNLAQYKAILASKYGINRLVEHYKSSSSSAPFSMRHVGKYLGLGGGNLEGTGYSARSPYEALAVTSYANRGLPVLYRGVAKGRDGYYAYQIYRK